MRAAHRSAGPKITTTRHAERLTTVCSWAESSRSSAPPIRVPGPPTHRPPNPACSWEDGAVDAYKIEGLLNKKDWSPAFVAWLLEKFNGWGYRLYHHVRSPYVWGATAVQQCGKYTSDRVWDATVMDPQIGGMALLAGHAPARGCDDVPAAVSYRRFSAGPRPPPPPMDHG